MEANILKLKWKLHQYRSNLLFNWGFRNGYIDFYDEKMIEKLRTIYHGGIPASILLLSRGMSNGHCYDRALLLSRVFLDEKDNVKLIYATIDTLKLKVLLEGENISRADHCFVERITKDGRHLIYDTSLGLVLDKKLYWLIQHPKIRHVNDKETIRKFVNKDIERWPEDVEIAKYASAFVLPMIEQTYNRGDELYSLNGMLQKEIEMFKKKINFNEVVEEINQDMTSMGLVK